MTWNLGAGLEDKGIIVTGAAGGIGTSVVGAFAAAGARVAAVDLDRATVDEVIAGLDRPDRHLAFGLDLSDLSAHEPMVRRVRDTFGGLHALANLAAVLRRKPVDVVTEDDWDFQLDINLKATFFLNRTCARVMKADQGGGRLINFTSQGWWSGGYDGSVVYSASKGGIVSMCRGLARTFGPDGITVNSVAPGAVDTPMMRGGMTDEALAAFVRQIPLGRMAEPEELAGVVVFLASEHGRYISGATINVSGGQLMY